MTRTRITQSILINASDAYDDTIAPSLANFETNPINAEEDLNSIRSMLSYLKDVQIGNWYDVQTAPSALEAGTLRGVDNLNDALHLVEKKRILRCVYSLADVTVGVAANFVILGIGQLPANTTAAVGAVTTLGTVVAAHGGIFGTHSLTEVAGSSALRPKNLMVIVDGVTRDPILSGGRQVYGLLQGETGVVDGATITTTTTTRVQISFVRINATGDDLEAVPAGDIQGRTINYCSVERVRFQDFNEGDFLNGSVVDVPAGATVTRQGGYDNQGVAPVDVTTNSTLDLEGPGLDWTIRDDLEAMLFQIHEGSVGGTSEVRVGVDVDVFNVDAAVNDFLRGARFDTGGQRINVGETAGVIESTGLNDLSLLGARELFLDDGNQVGSTWIQAGGIKLSDTTAEWNAFEAAFGEASILDAITKAAAASNRTRVQAVLTANVAADLDVNGLGGANNLNVNLPAYDKVTFLTDVDVFVNGVLLRNGINAIASEDVYPGTNPAAGDLRFGFALKGIGLRPDVVTVIVNGQ